MVVEGLRGIHQQMEVKEKNVRGGGEGEGGGLWEGGGAERRGGEGGGLREGGWEVEGRVKGVLW